MLKKNNPYLFLPAAISGILLIFCFPAFDIYPLAWIALSPFLVSLWDKKHGEAFLSGIIMGTFYFFGTIYWIYNSINNYGNISFLVSIFFVFVLSLYLSLYTGIFALLFSIKIRSVKLPAMLLAPLFWVTLEFIRAYAFTGFPWASIGYSQYRFLYGIQYADITGFYGVSFLILAVNGAIADIFITKKRQAVMPLFPIKQTIFGHAAVFCMLISAFTYGYIRLHEHRTGNNIKVSVIQGNIEQDKKWLPEYQNAVLDIYQDLTKKVSLFNPDIIIWPETAVPFYFGVDSAKTSSFIDFKKQINSDLLFGSVLIKDSSLKNKPPLFTNSAILLDKNGRVSYAYDKIHLVPFGEYVPLHGLLFFINKLVSGIGDFAPGEQIIKAYRPYGSFGTFICYEIIFPGLVRKFYSKDGDFIVTITNDAWFGKTAGPFQHFSMAVFRAIENRKPLIRAANTGVSGFIDSNGRILKTTSIFERTADTSIIKTDTTKSFYSKYGDVFSYICIVGTLLILI